VKIGRNFQKWIWIFWVWNDRESIGESIQKQDESIDHRPDMWLKSRKN
jgi:hypothetical protein